MAAAKIIPLVAGNWKMNGLAAGAAGSADEIVGRPKHREVARVGVRSHEHAVVIKADAAGTGHHRQMKPLIDLQEARDDDPVRSMPQTRTSSISP